MLFLFTSTRTNNNNENDIGERCIEREEILLIYLMLNHKLNFIIFPPCINCEVGGLTYPNPNCFGVAYKTWCPISSATIIPNCFRTLQLIPNQLRYPSSIWNWCVGPCVLKVFYLKLLGLIFTRVCKELAWNTILLLQGLIFADLIFYIGMAMGRGGSEG